MSKRRARAWPSLTQVPPSSSRAAWARSARGAAPREKSQGTRKCFHAARKTCQARRTTPRFPAADSGIGRNRSSEHDGADGVVEADAAAKGGSRALEVDPTRVEAAEELHPGRDRCRAEPGASQHLRPLLLRLRDGGHGPAERPGEGRGGVGGRTGPG